MIVSPIFSLHTFSAFLLYSLKGVGTTCKTDARLQRLLYAEKTRNGKKTRDISHDVADEKALYQTLFSSFFAFALLLNQTLQVEEKKPVQEVEASWMAKDNDFAMAKSHSPTFR